MSTYTLPTTCEIIDHDNPDQPTMIYALTTYDGKVVIGQTQNVCQSITRVNSGVSPNLRETRQVDRVIAAKDVTADRTLESVYNKFVANTGGLMSQAKTNAVNWDRAVELHEQLAGLLATAFAEEVSGDLSQGVQSVDDMALAKLDAVNNCLGRKGVHGHAEFIAVCHEKLPAVLEGWSGERPWIVEVGCSREIKKGDRNISCFQCNGTAAQILSYAVLAANVSN